MLAHVAVAEPGLVGKCDHGILSLLLDLGQFDASCAQELLAAVGHHASHVVNELSHEYATVEANVQVELPLRDDMLLVS